MAGFSIMLLWLPFLAMWGAMTFAFILYLLYSYLLESVFCMRYSKSAGLKHPALAWIAFWGQYLLGKAAGMKYLGAALAVDHIIILLLYICCGTSYYVVMYGLLLLFVAAGFVLKAVICHRIYKIAVPGYYKLLSVLCVISLGVLRPVFLLFVNIHELARKSA